MNLMHQITLQEKLKNLVNEKGVMSCPDPKSGKTLNSETAKKLKDLFESEEIS